MVLQLPNRNAVLVAKEGATIGRLSNARFEARSRSRRPLLKRLEAKVVVLGVTAYRVM
jgi:hypothetical protein